MENKLMYVGITHETAPVSERTYYALTKVQKQILIRRLTKHFAIKALTVLTTCNRTEIYFESNITTPYEVRDYLMEFVKGLHQVHLEKTNFLIINRSEETAEHLLKVANGLRSAVIGDKQIFAQVKESYLEALSHKNQGSLMERAYQAVFRSHKRVNTESLYQQGSTSTAYSALKMIEAHFGACATNNLSLLVVGAGEIAEDILKYTRKFKFKNISIANRTEQKANLLSTWYHIDTYSWDKVENNDFSPFDVIVTAVSNRKNLIYNIKDTGNKKLWIDLAMPYNVNPTLANYSNTVFNIDEVTRQVQSINNTQLNAIPKVELILLEELQLFNQWLGNGKRRQFLKSLKQKEKQKYLSSVENKIKSGLLDLENLENMAELMANRQVRDSIKNLKSISR